MSSSLIEEAFGEDCDLYGTVLCCPREADAAQLRKAYYRAALKYHPDKNDSKEASIKFQAISLAYQILKDDDLRRDYDESGVIPSDEAIDEETKDTHGADAWKEYFDRIFGKVTTSKIDAFSAKYKCSDEERRDVLREFTARKGNLVKMLDFVMLSEARDALRWAEDYLRPALETGELDKKYVNAMEKSLEKVQKKVEKEQEEAENEDEETETEEDDEEEPAKRASKKQKTPPKKAKPTKTKRKSKKQDNSMQDLVAQIQNKNRGGNMFASLGARYGVSMEEDDDPLNDADFAKIQAKLDKKKKTKRT